MSQIKETPKSYVSESCDENVWREMGWYFVSIFHYLSNCWESQRRESWVASGKTSRGIVSQPSPLRSYLLNVGGICKNLARATGTHGTSVFRDTVLTTPRLRRWGWRGGERGGWWYCPKRDSNPQPLVPLLYPLIDWVQSVSLDSVVHSCLVNIIINARTFCCISMWLSQVEKMFGFVRTINKLLRFRLISVLHRSRLLVVSHIW